MSNQLSQRVIYAGLRRMTKDRVVIKRAYDHWQSELSHNEFDIVTIVNSLVDFLGSTSAEKKTLTIALHSASNKLLDELDPVPGIISGAGNDDIEPTMSRAENAPAKKTSPAQLVTQRYLQVFGQHVRKVDKDDFTEFRRAVSKEGIAGLDKSTATVITSWANSGMANLDLPSDISEDMCKTLTHGFYMLACEFIGPNVCDDIVVKAVNTCLDMEEAARFNPRDLV